jgi:hypothetical protein
VPDGAKLDRWSVGNGGSLKHFCYAHETLIPQMDPS